MSYNFFYKLFSQCSPYHLWKTFIIIIIIKIVIILLCLFLACGCKKFNYSVCNSNLKHASVDVSQAKKFHNTLSPLVMFRWTEWECWKLLLLSFVELEQTGRGAGGGCKRSGVDVVPTHTHTHSLMYMALGCVCTSNTLAQWTQGQWRLCFWVCDLVYSCYMSVMAFRLL